MSASAGDLRDLLAEEAHLLDSREFHRWLGLLSDDVRYFIPTPEVVRPKRLSGNANATDESPSRPRVPAELGELRFEIMDEDKEGLRLRVDRLLSGLAHGEMPPSRTVRVLGSVLVSPLVSELGAAVVDPGTQLWSARSAFIMTQVRHTPRLDTFAGHRTDEWRLTPAGWQLVSRRVDLLQSVMPRAIATFF